MFPIGLSFRDPSVPPRESLEEIGKYEKYGLKIVGRSIKAKWARAHRTRKGYIKGNFSYCKTIEIHTLERGLGEL